MSGGQSGAMSHGKVPPSKLRRAAARILLSLAIPIARGATPALHLCQRVTIEGEVNAGQEWNATLGGGWVFRVVPITASQAAYSGWDLVMDRQPPAGYPDALLLATLPYDSINQREIGTTFGLRAQDAIGWNPRSFHFVSDPRQFREGQQWFLQVMQARSARASNAEAQPAVAGPMARLLELSKTASSGELRILDARIVPGVADPKPYAQAWALAASRTHHEVQHGQASAEGRLVWMRFGITLWLPPGWRLSSALHSARLPCSQ